MIPKNRIHRAVRRGWNVLAVRNSGGYFVVTTRRASRHSKARLVLRLPDKPEIVLNGRQIITLEKLLHELRILRKRTPEEPDLTEEQVVAGEGWHDLVLPAAGKKAAAAPGPEDPGGGPETGPENAAGSGARS